MNLSQLARSISESPTLKLNEAARRLREKGEPVIHLGGGEPTSRTPIDAIVRCTAVLNTGEVRYAPADGIPALKQAVIRYTEDHYGRKPRPENVLISSGTKHAIMVALHAVLDPHEEVIIPAPYWASYPEMVRIAGGVPVKVVAEDGGFIPSVDEIAEAVGSHTKAVIVNSPHNPTGVVYPPEVVAGIVRLCEERGLFLIVDDIYNRLLFDGRTATNVYDYCGSDIDASRVIVVNGVSKTYAMTGFRVGWAIGAPDLIRAMGNIQSQETSGAATPSQWAAVGALNGVQSSVETLRLTLQNNRNVMIERLRAIPGVQVTEPGGAFYCFPDFKAYRTDSQQLAAFLLEKVRVVTIPGREFGMDGHLRLSFCASTKEIIEGLERIRWALDPSTPNELYVGDHRLVRDWL
ncbi:MAG: pyridoxal phosphate-dependent aminotransferase [Actinomycetota bacterium]